jgi:CBS domain-containing protein
VVQSRLRTVAVWEIMTADLATGPASATVDRFLHELLPWLRHSAFPVVDDGRTVGLVTVRRVNAVPADERARTTLREVACPLAEVAKATPDEAVAEVLPRLGACSDRRALVFADGRLAGIVAPADISRPLERISGNRGPNPGLR